MNVRITVVVAPQGAWARHLYWKHPINHRPPGLLLSAGLKCRFLQVAKMPLLLEHAKCGFLNTLPAPTLFLCSGVSSQCVTSLPSVRQDDTEASRHPEWESG